MRLRDRSLFSLSGKSVGTGPLIFALLRNQIFSFIVFATFVYRMTHFMDISIVFEINCPFQIEELSSSFKLTKWILLM